VCVCVCVSILVILPRVCVCVCIERYLLTEFLNSPSYYLSFQALSLLAGYFIGLSEPALLVVICIFSLCLVSAPQL
jgi:hypothetical protein